MTKNPVSGFILKLFEVFKVSAAGRRFELLLLATKVKKYSLPLPDSETVTTVLAVDANPCKFP